MAFELRSNKDVWSGAMMIVIGAGAIIVARDFDFGTALRMGPGYFPSVLGGILIAFGLYLVASGMRSEDKIAGGWSLRALVVLPLSLVLFGLLMEYAGFVPAMLALIVGSAMAGNDFRLIEVLALAVGITIFAVALFIWALGMPYPLFTRW